MFSLFRNSKAPKTRKPARRERRLGLEPLEDRLALSSFYSLSNGVLTLYGDPYRFITDDSFTVDVDAASNNEVLVNVNGQTAGFASSLVQSIVINTGGGLNSVYLYANEVPVTVNSGGNDLVVLGKSGSCQALGDITLANPSFRTNLAIDDSADTSARIAYVGGDSVSQLWDGTVHFDNLSYLSIYAGSGGNNFWVYDTPATSDPNGGDGYTYISSGSGNDSVKISGTTGALQINGIAGTDWVDVGASGGRVIGSGRVDGIRGAVSISNHTHFGGGATHLIVDASVAGGSSATLTDGSLTGLAPAPISWGTAPGTWGGVVDLEIYTGYSVVDTFTVLNTSPFAAGSTLLTSLTRGAKTINVLGTTGALEIEDGPELFNPFPANTVYIGSTSPGTGVGTLGNIRGAVTLSDFDLARPQTVVNIDDSGDTQARTASFTGSAQVGTTLSGLSPAAILVSNYPLLLNVLGSAGGTAFDFSNSSLDMPVTLFGMSPADSIISPAAAFQHFHEYKPCTWTVSGVGSGQLTLDGTTNVSFLGIENLVGGGLPNIFRILAGGGLAGGINGGGAFNVIDYSAWTTGVTINLTTGTATGIAGGVNGVNNAIGGAGADSITGGASGGYLVGRGGNDAILGGAGRNVIIGSGGADALVGGSLSDLIISDRTSFGDYAGLWAVATEWLRTDKDYTGRMADLRTGGGLNGSTILAWGSTVLDDGSQDRLVGQAGRDWFFANLYSGVIDIIQDLNNGGAEQVN